MITICCNFTKLSAGYRSNHMERKVRTAESNTPVNGRLPIYGKEKVPQKITVLSNRDEGENVR